MIPAAPLERLRGWRPDWATPVFLAGNHEEVMLRTLGGEPEILSTFEYVEEVVEAPYRLDSHTEEVTHG